MRSDDGRSDAEGPPRRRRRFSLCVDLSSLGVSRTINFWKQQHAGGRLPLRSAHARRGRHSLVVVDRGAARRSVSLSCPVSGGVRRPGLAGGGLFGPSTSFPWNN